MYNYWINAITIFMNQRFELIDEIDHKNKIYFYEYILICLFPIYGVYLYFITLLSDKKGIK